MIDQHAADHRGQVDCAASENESDWAVGPSSSTSEVTIVLPVLLVAGVKVDIGPTVEL